MHKRECQCYLQRERLGKWRWALCGGSWFKISVEYLQWFSTNKDWEGFGGDTYWLIVLETIQSREVQDRTWDRQKGRY